MNHVVDGESSISSSSGVEVFPAKGKNIFAIVLAFLLLGFLAGAIFWFKWKQAQRSQLLSQTAEKAIAVTATTVKEDHWQPYLEAVASLSAGQSVIISSDTPGIVTKTPLVSGAMVKEGDLLVQLDSDLEEAQLRSAEAELGLAKSKLERTISLSSKSVIVARAELDQAKAEYDQALAGIDQIQAKIRKKSICAPFDGMLGISQVAEGQYLQSGDKVVSLDNFEEINVDFTLPQQDLSEVHPGQDMMVTADGAPNNIFEGKITAIDSQLDETTRNIPIQGSVNNKEGLLRGGMFAKVRIMLPEKQKVITLPTTAVNYAPYGDSVFVIKTISSSNGKNEQRVEEQLVTLGKTRGDQVEILKGVKVGDQVVTSGIFKLHPGELVTIDDQISPSDNPAPEPQDS